MTKTIFAAVLVLAALLFGCSRNPMREQADHGLPLTNAAPINLNAAIARAKAERKIVLLDFTGSDWCPPCIKLHDEIFSKPEFQKYAQTNLVFLVVDFPLKFRLPPEASVTNNFLARKFNVDGPPTLIALDGKGKEIWKHLGPIDGGPQKLFAELEAAKKKQR